MKQKSFSEAQIIAILRQAGREEIPSLRYAVNTVLPVSPSTVGVKVRWPG